METFIFDGKGANLQKAIDVQSRGGRVLCPKCKNELIIATGTIYCPVSQKHLCCFWTTTEVMSAFERFMNERHEKNEEV
ncbi:hypothetical protein [Aerosakkonema funiforme]|uniref:Uncharacterized protein n=1 Tax=Aerosakkonema funiforme FACHB-1375 TaxID=2949571 RepID=A0A926VA45_9CYAN|nr:hypothetical protein [Aerosakkonema funiforme]MBD2180091.1 hypothetical protein [Aerosakkonema funiforme FACHB-1375]